VEPPRQAPLDRFGNPIERWQWDAAQCVADGVVADPAADTPVTPRPTTPGWPGALAGAGAHRGDVSIGAQLVRPEATQSWICAA
jgi:hypothetical protein